MSSNLIELTVEYQTLTRKQFNYLFDRGLATFGLYAYHARFLTAEQITKAIANGNYIWKLYDEVANKLNDEHIMMAIDDEMENGEEDISYLFTNRTVAVSDEVVKHACDKIDTLIGDDILIYGSRLEYILDSIRNSEVVTTMQNRMAEETEEKLNELVELYDRGAES